MLAKVGALDVDDRVSQFGKCAGKFVHAQQTISSDSERPTIALTLLLEQRGRQFTLSRTRSVAFAGPRGAASAHA